MRDHTSLFAWQEAEAVCLAVIDLGKIYWRPAVSHLYWQLSRSSLSVQLNIAEGYSFTESPTFRRHLRIAYGSAVETADLLHLLIKSNSVPEQVVGPILERCRRSQKLIMGLIHRAQSQEGQARE
ncbi:MAG: four helix bundle protein [Gemmatimonadota bacterium]